MAITDTRPAGKPGQDMTIDLPLYTSPNPWRFVVEAEIVPVEHLAMVATFAVHLLPPIWTVVDCWRVTNVETGLAMNGCDAPSRDEAVAKLLECCRDKTAADILRAYRTWAPEIVGKPGKDRG
jgi:hypothetical protein